MTEITLAHGDALATVALLGAEARSWRIAGRDLLWPGDPAIWSDINPILYPVVGWTRDGEERVDGVRYPLGLHFYELPAGRLEPEEASIEAAKRELLEETGYVAAEWRELGRLHPCIGYSNEHIDFFLARKLEFKSARPDEGEFLETLRMPLADTIDWIRRGRITDTKTIVGLFWAEKLQRENW